MTDISKDAVERFEPEGRDDKGFGPGVEMVADASGEWVHYSDYVALLARVEELEAQTHDQFKASFDRGVLQGLDEAVCEIDNATSQEAYDADCRIHFDDLQEFFSTRVEALKEQQS